MSQPYHLLDAPPGPPRRRVIAIVGARPDKLARVPPAWVELYRRAAEYTARRGSLITTGAAPGGDQLAAEIALAAAGQVELYLPWESFQRTWVDRIQARYPDQVAVVTYNPEDAQHLMWEARIDDWHPVPERIRPQHRPLLARTGGILWDAQAVVALPLRDGDQAGGTGYAIALAHGLNQSLRAGQPMSVFDLSRPAAREWWEWKLAQER